MVGWKRQWYETTPFRRAVKRQVPFAAMVPDSNVLVESSAVEGSLPLAVLNEMDERTDQVLDLLEDPERIGSWRSGSGAGVPAPERRAPLSPAGRSSRRHQRFVPP